MRNAANIKAHRTRLEAAGHRRVDCMLSPEAFEALCELQHGGETYSAALRRVLIERKKLISAAVPPGISGN